MLNPVAGKGSISWRNELQGPASRWREDNKKPAACQHASPVREALSLTVRNLTQAAYFNPVLANFHMMSLRCAPSCLSITFYHVKEMRVETPGNDEPESLEVEGRDLFKGILEQSEKPLFFQRTV
jgi:hypothetical protein